MLMLQPKIHLCNLFGIPLNLDFSLIILLLIFATSGGSPYAGIVCAFLLLVSITLHELGHALTARAFGYRTRDITLSLLGGCASLIAMPRKAYQEFLTAVAGPAMSFALAAFGMLGISLAALQGGFCDALGWVVSNVLYSFGIHVSFGGTIYWLESRDILIHTLLYFSVMNLMLGIFNLLPGFPMDGGRVFRSVMRQFMTRVRATYVAMVVGRVVAVGLGLKGLWNVVHGANWGYVTLLIAWMIWKEGYREYRMAVLEAGWYSDDSQRGFCARVSPPPYGGDSEDRPVDRA